LSIWHQGIAFGNRCADWVCAKENLGGIAASLKQGGNAKVEDVVSPSLNHMFQTTQTGAENEYGRIDETIAPATLQRVAKFANKVSTGSDLVDVIFETF
jgi:hypothetical protein